jgi:hypothetical protein
MLFCEIEWSASKVYIQKVQLTANHVLSRIIAVATQLR